jgi:CO/xanthine dehydrogenase FAD-binding subunit
VRGPQRFLKVGARGSIITAVAQCALVLDLDRREVRCGLGAVGPVPVRPSEAERFAAQALDWSALRADDDVPRRFGELAAQACDPPSDVHASAAYRRHAAAVLAERALRRSLAT